MGILIAEVSSKDPVQAVTVVDPGDPVVRLDVPVDVPADLTEDLDQVAEVDVELLHTCAGG